jgi:hypothetical protein
MCTLAKPFIFSVLGFALYNIACACCLKSTNRKQHCVLLFPHYQGNLHGNVPALDSSVDCLA